MRVFSYLLLAALTWLSPSVMAQTPFQLSEEKLPTDDVAVDALVFSIGADMDAARKHFKTYIGKEYKLKVKGDGKWALKAEAVSIPAISAKRGDLRAMFVSADTAYRMGIAYALGYDIFVNSTDYPAEMAQLRKLTLGFVQYHFTETYTELIATDEKALKKTKKELKSAEKRQKKLKKAVLKNEEKALNASDTEKATGYEEASAEAKAALTILKTEIPNHRAEILRLEAEVKASKTALNALIVRLDEMRAGAR